MCLPKQVPLVIVDLSDRQSASESFTVQWRKSLPFAVNPRGVLAHRVKSVHTHRRGNQWTHTTAMYWCGNMAHGVHFSPDTGGRILCARCEALAVTAGQVKADELVGRHVHIGGIRPFRTCCLGDESN